MSLRWVTTQNTPAPSEMTFSDKHQEMEELGWFVVTLRRMKIVTLSAQALATSEAILKTRMRRLFESMSRSEQVLCETMSPQRRFKISKGP